MVALFTVFTKVNKKWIEEMQGGFLKQKRRFYMQPLKVKSSFSALITFSTTDVGSF
jgi:hypothetical protein